MRKLKIKDGVSLAGLKKEMRIAIIEADDIYRAHGKELWITEYMGGEHSPRSLHYGGYALDMRTKFFGVAEAQVVAKKLQEALGDDYDVVLHTTHLHVEYDPKEKQHD